MSWATGRMCGFDLETTGTDVESDRIVTACVVLCDGGQPVQSSTWLADPGVNIPAAATAVHGVSSERARSKGRSAAEVVDEVTSALADALPRGIPVVAMNARFDLTLLDRECRRYGLPTLLDRVPDSVIWPVIDPLVIDKQVDRYRRGSRTLEALCAHYRVALDSAHEAASDALGAARLAWRLGTQYPRLAAMDVEELHHCQIAWAAEQAVGLREYFLRTPGKEHMATGVSTEWPMVPSAHEGVTT